MGKTLVHSATIRCEYPKQETVEYMLPCCQVSAQYLADAPMSKNEIVKELLAQIYTANEGRHQTTTNLNQFKTQ